jgi:hypothetical protein
MLKSSLSNPGAATEIINLSSSLDTLVFVEVVFLVGIVAVVKSGSKRESKRLVFGKLLVLINVVIVLSP